MRRQLAPDDVERFSDPVYLDSTQRWYREQADLSTEGLWHEVRHGISQQEKLRTEYEQRIAELQHLLRPRVYLRRGFAKVVTTLKRRVNRWRGREALTLPAFQDISFSLHSRPVVSVVIPMFNLLDLTLDCLRSLSTVREQIPFEVVVVDDASTDPRVGPVLRRIPGLTYVRQPTNGGFVPSCNAGAGRVRGSFIYFLNNDTRVHDQWLYQLVSLFDDARVGAAGSKLVHPNGRLQEAGGIIFSSGQAWNYGKTDDPDRPEYSFVRDVDYCSGAGLIVRRSLFEKIGGFKAELAPGYYEDVELCFAVREQGYRVLYQPRSVVTHLEGASSAPGLTGMKEYQAINFKKFKRMRARDLLKQPVQDDRSLWLAARRKRGKRIWVFDFFQPAPDSEYGSTRMLAILRQLARDNTVVFTTVSLHDHPERRRVLENMGIEVIARRPGVNLSGRLRIEGPHIDLLVVSRPDVMHHFYGIIRDTCSRAQIVYDTVDIHHVRLERQLTTLNDETMYGTVARSRDWFKRLEVEYGTRADIVWAVSEADKKILQKLLPGKPIDVVSTAHEIVQTVVPYKQRKNLFFVGSFHHHPNRAAVEHYVTSIDGRIRQQLPNVKLAVAGRPIPAELKKLVAKKSPESVRLLGYITDPVLFESLDRARVFVCPLTFGSGLKGKILMAMSRGLPVITTSVGAEGIAAVDGEEIIIADTPDDFAAAVVRLYTDHVAWQRQSRAGLSFIKRCYSAQNLEAEINLSLKC